jgi:hypothetical protein
LLELHPGRWRTSAHRFLNLAFAQCFALGFVAWVHRLEAIAALDFTHQVLLGSIEKTGNKAR